ncbi:Uu.00g131520.m01.CDS01 [Anthostomella pinea]|uniref:Uu.00g131520.m01.CDS01 n=1 Tax=Anthostomella pinea TaxID=933095 RepID=A0AAI8YFV5_9PEZI|nr:Uu.00g131520.m01.CDS01 [Anthostomella pinea]
MAHRATFLVLGATGGTGKHFVIQALQDGHKVRALVRTPDKLPSEVRDNKDLQILQGSITDDTLDTDGLVAGVDYRLDARGRERTTTRQDQHGIREEADPLHAATQRQLPWLLWAIRYTVARGYGGQHEDNEVVHEYLTTEAKDIEWSVHLAGIGSDGPSKGTLERSETQFSIGTHKDCAAYNYRTVMDPSAVHTCQFSHYARK